MHAPTDAGSLDRCVDAMLLRHGKAASEAARDRAYSELEAGDEDAAVFWATVAAKVHDMIRTMC